MEQAILSLDDNLKSLAPEDLGRVRRWVEDRFVNAVCPLAVRLRLVKPDMVWSDHTLHAAQVAVERVLAAVEEVRNMDKRTES
jgi:acetoin utilization deacetylase AcuC-like enzyme